MIQPKTWRSARGDLSERRISPGCSSMAEFQRRGRGVESIELEGEGPLLGVLVVIFEDVASCHFFPLVHGLFDN